MRHIAVILVLLLPFPAFAGVYKCDVGGKIVYQQTPCADTPGSDTGIKTHGYSNATSAVPRSVLKPDEIKKLEQIRAEKLAREQARKDAELARPIVNIPKPELEDCFRLPGQSRLQCQDRNDKRKLAFEEQVQQAKLAGAKITHFPQAAVQSSSAAEDLQKE